MTDILQRLKTERRIALVLFIAALAIVSIVQVAQSTRTPSELVPQSDTSPRDPIEP